MTTRNKAALKAELLSADQNDLGQDLVDSLFASATGQRYITFAGRSGAGAITLTGAVVGDTVKVVGLSAGALGNASASFEATITVANQIQQSSASNLSANNYMAILLPSF